MIEPDRRKAVYLLAEGGMSGREIALKLGISRNTVNCIIRQKGVMPAVCANAQQIDEELLRTLYRKCGGYAQRVHEKLTEENGIDVTYSTLTRMLRNLGISNPRKSRCDRVPDKPGEEMQHDTTIYQRQVGGRRVKLVASILYLRYSKQKYLKLYRHFNRFTMKCFLHEALMFWGYAAKHCIIDNTNLARLRGTGARAVIVPEMKFFAKQYGFDFICHELRHPNRKAGEERCFWTTETNFLPGRTFESMEDLNQQAFEWSTLRMANRPQSKTGLIPARAFEHEQPQLIELPPHLPPPCRVHERRTDQYGYAAFAANYYWVPGVRRDDIKVLEYADRLQIYKARERLAEYPLPAEGISNERFSPEGQPQPRYKPRNCKKPTQQEENHLRGINESVNAYMDFALKSMGLKRHGFLRKLFALSRAMTAELFIKSVERAHQYRITNPAVIERIAALYMTDSMQALPFAETDDDFRYRDSYLEGRLTDLPDLSVYDHMEEDDDNER